MLALWASAAVLASGGEFRHSLWTIPSIGTLTVLLDRVSAFFLFIAAIVVLASSVFSAAYMKRYAGHYSLAAFGWYLALCASMRRGSKRFAFAYLECTCKWIFDCWVQHGRTHSQTETMSCCIRLLNFSSTGFQSGFPPPATAGTRIAGHPHTPCGLIMFSSLVEEHSCHQRPLAANSCLPD